MTKSQNAQMARQAVIIAQIFSGEMQYSDPGVNRVAAEAMLLGWLSAQPWFIKHKREQEKKHAREDVFLTMRDQTLEAISNAVGDLAHFDESKSVDTNALKDQMRMMRGHALLGFFAKATEQKQNHFLDVIAEVDAATASKLRLLKQ